MIRVRFTLPQSLPVAEQGRVVSRHAPIIMSTLRGSHLPATRKGLQGGQRPLRQRGQCAQIPLPDCLRTFRHYPEGVDSHDQSVRLRGLAALAWGLGLSHRSVSDLLMAPGCDLSRMRSWRDVTEGGAWSGWWLDEQDIWSSEGDGSGPWSE